MPSINDEFIAAARDGRIDKVEALLKSGADIDAVSSSGGTALCWAAECGHAHVVDLLLSRGGNRHIAGGPGLWAYWSAGGKQLDVLSVTRADPDVNALWVNAGLPVERRDNYTMTELRIGTTCPSSVDLVEAADDCSGEVAIAVIKNVLDNKKAAYRTPYVAAFTHLTSGISSYFEVREKCSVVMYALDCDASPKMLSGIRVGSVFVKGPLTQLGFAHYSLRHAIADAGYEDIAAEIREIYHYFEASESDGNITELQIAI